jgi:hypothetical protein
VLLALLVGCIKPPPPMLDAEHVQGRLVSEVPAGWKVRGPRVAARPEALGVFVDHEIARSGKSACILSVDATSEDWGSVLQSFYADDYRGRRVRFSGWMKTYRVSGWAGLWMGVDTKSLERVAYDDMEERGVDGTTDWTRYSVVLDVDPYAAVINIGVKLHGRGQVWLDDCTLEVVDKGVPVTDQFPLGRKPLYRIGRTLFDQPVNLSFDDERLE